MITDIQPPVKYPFSNVQLELLKLFADDVSEEDLKAIRRLLARYFAEKATAEADKLWEEKGYSADTLRHEHLRSPYKSAQKTVKK